LKSPKDTGISSLFIHTIQFFTKSILGLNKNEQNSATSFIPKDQKPYFTKYYFNSSYLESKQSCTISIHRCT